MNATRTPGTAEPDESSQQRFLEPHAPEPGRAWSWSARRRADQQADQPGAGADRFDATEDEDAPVYVISVAAELADLHPQTLRAYEREGLLTPARTEGGTRRYSHRDVERLRLIKTLTTDEGLNLAGVRVVLELGEKLEGARRRVGELEEMVRVLAERLDARPAGDRFDLVKSPTRDVEVHQLRRRTGQRGSSPRPNRPPVQRATPIPPPERRSADA
ncbi:heat shock protein transcriptional repressor HspR [Nitriliruptor alkaliphilus]|uniref:heat shock protein transcriptional repressor HspR n=1 Tax=Nitriliruptor alkaliphilus TaxID=427918 RepID=UPI0009F8E817|nr:helix-turn-helix transcriptional regulator [Nitriliruptor alkaliphilus]